MNTTDSESPLDEDANGNEQDQSVTPLELFFDLVFVFALTQITGFLTNNLTWPGVIRGAALLAVVWLAWVCYSWLTNTIPAEEVLFARLVILLAMAAMLVVALSIPRAFSDDAVLFGAAYFVVRALHVVLYGLITPPETRNAVLRLAPGFLGAPLLLILAGFVGNPLEGVLWILAITVDFGVARFRGVEGFYVRANHFVERHRLVVIVALGESIVAIGVGATNLTLDADGVLAVFSGFVLIASLWWLYFDYITLAAEHRLTATHGHERAVLARDSYSYIHLLMIGGIIFTALGIEQTLVHVNEPLGLIPAVALCGGGTLYLCGHNAYRFRDHGTISVPRAIAAMGSSLLIPLAVVVPSLVALASLTVLFVALAVFETVRSEYRREFRLG
ncbi:low temperature requirement protein A [Haladaptatus pallidirubidus]|uniref:Low temperature requirement protein A n=2 Tax=Haladaptatus pallidirubidus TaxID=1008152 RepID=A0AAV3UCS3_9EURY|nr:low temperature requirement protein A [Haladaptatus pallidirubidus]